MDELIEGSARVQRVDPPPFLFTRIEARLRDVHDLPSRSWVAAMAMTVIVLFMVNAYVLSNGARNEGSVEDVATGLGMNATNQLYHD